MSSGMLHRQTQIYTHTYTHTQTHKSRVITDSFHLETLSLKAGETCLNVVATQSKSTRDGKTKKSINRKPPNLDWQQSTFCLTGAILCNHDRWRPERHTTSSQCSLRRRGCQHLALFQNSMQRLTIDEEGASLRTGDLRSEARLEKFQSDKSARALKWSGDWGKEGTQAACFF